jgi:hypothetical protein
VQLAQTTVLGASGDSAAFADDEGLAVLAKKMPLLKISHFGMLC